MLPACRYLRFLSGEQVSLMEVSYTKQQQKQKQKASNKNQDADTMATFDKRHQLSLSFDTRDYFAYVTGAGARAPALARAHTYASPVGVVIVSAFGRPRSLAPRGDVWAVLTSLGVRVLAFSSQAARTSRSWR